MIYAIFLVNSVEVLCNNSLKKREQVNIFLDMFPFNRCTKIYDIRAKGMYVVMAYSTVCYKECLQYELQL